VLKEKKNKGKRKTREYRGGRKGRGGREEEGNGDKFLYIPVMD
jgi:hypothetical protein